MRYFLVLSAFFIMCYSCTVRHEQTLLVEEILEEPNNIKSILEKSSCGMNFIDSLKSKPEKKIFLIQELSKYDKYAIQNFGFLIRKKNFIEYDFQGEQFSKIVIKSKDLSNMEFIFRAEKNNCQLVNIGVASN